MALHLFVAVLAVWRVTHLLQAEDGPWGLIAGLRRRAGASFAGQLLGCFYCLSLWVALPLALCLGRPWRERLVLWPALSAGAILVERLSAGRQALPAGFVEERAGQEVN